MTVETEPTLETLLHTHKRRGDGWEPPVLLDLSRVEDRVHLTRLLHEGVVTEVIDPVTEITDDLFALRHPDTSNDLPAREAFRLGIADAGITFGTWVHFPWNGTLVRYPDRDDHRALRTFRNCNLVTASEQRTLATASIAVVGLSVGSNIVDQLVQSGIGDTYVVGDFDIVSPTNLNRIRAHMGHVGLPKVDVTARKISESDPFVTQVHLRDGYTETTDAALDAHRPDVIVEEVDDIPAKAALREYARTRRIPLVMVTDLDDKAILDVERHDLGRVRPFNGRVSAALFERMVADDLSEQEKMRALMKIVGVRHITPRTLESAMEIGSTLGGLPQLGTTAAAGATLATIAVREILLGRRIRSGSYVHSPKRTLGLEHRTTKREAARIVRRFVDSRRADE